MTKKEIVIFGAGGFGREVQWLIERINENEDSWIIKGYIDDGRMPGEIINGYKVLGGIEYLLNHGGELAVTIAVGSARIRKIIHEKCKQNSKLYYPNLIDPSAIMSDRIVFGEGNIVCAACVLTVNIEIGNFMIMNLDCTLGHDAIIHDYVTIYPSVNISGMVDVGEESELGTGSQVIQGIHICNNVIVGAGATVVKNLDLPGTYVGAPAKRIK